MTEESLKDKTLKGVGWSAVDNVAQHAEYSSVNK